MVDLSEYIAKDSFTRVAPDEVNNITGDDAQIIRIFLIIAIIGQLWWSLDGKNVIDWFGFLTYLSMWLTLSYLGLSMVYHEFEADLIGSKEFLVIFGSITMGFLYFVTIFAWLVLHPVEWFSENFALDTPEKIERHVRKLLSHSLPITLSAINMYLLNDVIAYNEHWWIMFILTNVYIVWNYVFYTITG